MVIYDSKNMQYKNLIYENWKNLFLSLGLHWTLQSYLIIFEKTLDLGNSEEIRLQKQ
jgi:hypothetical protein